MPRSSALLLPTRGGTPYPRTPPPPAATLIAVRLSRSCWAKTVATVQAAHLRPPVRMIAVCHGHAAVVRTASLQTRTCSTQTGQSMGMACAYLLVCVHACVRACVCACLCVHMLVCAHACVCICAAICCHAGAPVQSSRASCCVGSVARSSAVQLNGRSSVAAQLLPCLEAGRGIREKSVLSGDACATFTRLLTLRPTHWMPFAHEPSH